LSKADQLWTRRGLFVRVLTPNADATFGRRLDLQVSSGQSDRSPRQPALDALKAVLWS
jgi:hypothetical protein